ncbi:MAG TPA: HPF/RaiA family ribosome-associated protein [Burkholderiaceae bacterium]|nr:HPF/RaiA family ribosome-associated protein [Burkholderiaceae bacterium]
MKLPLQIAFREMPKSDAVEADIQRHAAKLDEFCDHIMSCRVTVEAPARHKHQGRLYSVHIDLKAPSEEIASTRHHEHEDVYVAIRDAFDAVKRRLEDYVRKQRGQTKPHAPLVHGRIVRLFEAGHGFIEDDDGNEYYFDRASVERPSFDQLEVGAAVEFLAELAALGRQAKRVSVSEHHAA